LWLLALGVAASAACAGVRRPDGVRRTDGGAGGNGPPARVCVDEDGDGRGPGCALGPDCFEHDPTAWICPYAGDPDTEPDAGPPVGWGNGPDAGAPPETNDCPPGDLRVHVKDLWSAAASPTLGLYDAPPPAVVLLDRSYNEYAARADTGACGWYVACVPSAAATTIYLQPESPAELCGATSHRSGGVDLSAFGAGQGGRNDVWIDYGGPSAGLAADYTTYPTVPQGPQAFRLGDTGAADAACAPAAAPAGLVKLHIRWPWSDPAQTGFAGTACEDEKLGFSTPPFPTGIEVSRQACASAAATLDYAGGGCPWYTILIPAAQWTGTLTLRYGDSAAGLFSPAIPLPQPRAADEYWLAYEGAPDDGSNKSNCMNWSQRANVYQFYTVNPGPGFAGCGGGAPPATDPCTLLPPADHSIVHFRYIWAGQKTFTFFPQPAFMPKWMVLEVNGGGGDKDVICWREADRPWFSCPVPNAEFHAGATWRAVDKTHDPEWNTVAARPFPGAAGEYWLRWYYGKPDIPATSQFKFFAYDPDTSANGGGWSATGSWSDARCAPHPSPTAPPPIGYGAWFPYASTGYRYPFGGSLASVYRAADTVQDLLNRFVWERYQIWKANYIADDDCAVGAARVKTDPPQTVSEGQGYGMAISAAIGDRELFDRLWLFVRHRLSQSAKKYCGGLMGWMWDGEAACRPLDVPCDPDTGTCGGNDDSAFDGDVDIAIGLLFAARQWPTYTTAAVDWLLKMECEINAAYDTTGAWAFPAPGDTWDKSCQGYPGRPCFFQPGQVGTVNLSYDPPGYFRAFGEFLQQELPAAGFSAAQRQQHRDFWYKAAATVWEMTERCYDGGLAAPALVTDWGHYTTPCDANTDNYNWSRALWRLAVDAAWYGDQAALPENAPGSSPHYPGKSRLQAKMDLIQRFYAAFHAANPTEPNANRFSTICQDLTPAGTVTGCDPAYGHNSYFVGTAMCAYATGFDDGGQTDTPLRQEALEEAVSTTIENDRYYQESIGVYTLLFLTGNFPNPMQVP
jgi:hypothetical protein